MDERSLGEMLGREYVLRGLEPRHKALKAKYEGLLREAEEMEKRAGEARMHAEECQAQLVDLEAKIEQAKALPSVELVEEETKGAGPKRKRKTGPTAGRDEVKAATVKIVEEEGPITYKDLLGRVVESVKTSGKSGQGVHSTLKKILREEPFSESRGKYSIKPREDA